MSAFADSRGLVFGLFRSATEIVNRDMYLLNSSDHGQSFRGTNLSKWNVGACVMSSEKLEEGRKQRQIRRQQAAWRRD